MDKAPLDRALLEINQKVYDYLMSEHYEKRFRPDHIRDAVYSYIKRKGKCLRPAVLLFSCGAVGGNEQRAMPAAAAIEVFHTLALVHDDIIDMDKTRRGGPTVHEEFRNRAFNELCFNETEAENYGRSVTILAGDMQQGWGVTFLCELIDRGIDPSVVLYLIKDVETHVLSTMVEGEMLDLQYSRLPLNSLDEDVILSMLWKKTGVAFEFAGKAGAMIGLNTGDPRHELVLAISAFASKCGVAFQLQDDILGIVGDTQSLRKPVGSDIRAGKPTVILSHALRNADEKAKTRLLTVLGNSQATTVEVEEVRHLAQELGSIEYAEDLAKLYVKDAIAHLELIPESNYKNMLVLWANYLIERSF